MLDIIYDHDYMHVLHILCVYNPLLHAFDQMTVTCAYFKTFKTSMVTFPSKSYDHDASPTGWEWHVVITMPASQCPHARVNLNGLDSHHCI